MLNRRVLLKSLAGIPAIISLPSPHAAEPATSKPVADYLSLTRDLLRVWCDGMLAHQVHAPGDLALHGGLWSPADIRILGRCGDAVYPLLCCAGITGEEKYVTAAELVMDWSLHNVSQADGSWLNEVGGFWRGITVFSSIALGQALYFHGDLINNSTRDQWLDRLQSAARWLRANIDIDYSNINYPIATAYAMALLGRLLSSSNYRDYGKELGEQAMNQFTPRDGLLHGEGRQNEQSSGYRTPKGCYPVDMGYNVEESLPSLVQYALFEDDQGMQSTLVDNLRTHLHFMLPDGSWDNSWGSRNYKWTWWGSRTSDGCATAYALLADRNPHFLEAAIRNTELLKRCTHEGLLHAGVHLHTRGLPPSIHHTFCHAKSLAQVLDGRVLPNQETATTLPREIRQGAHVFNDIATHTVSLEPWYGTFTAYDFLLNHGGATHPMGGAMSVLWHRRAGPLVAASMGRYVRLEKTDMARETGLGYAALTPRLELVKSDRPARGQVSAWDRDQIALYSDTYDASARLVVEQNAPGIVTIVAHSHVVDEHQAAFAEPGPSSEIRYTFEQNQLEIEIRIRDLPAHAQLEYSLPIISDSSEAVVRQSITEMSLQKQNCSLRLSATKPILLSVDALDRIFNPIPGFEALPLRFDASNGLRLQLQIV